MHRRPLRTRRTRPPDTGGDSSSTPTWLTGPSPPHPYPGLRNRQRLPRARRAEEEGAGKGCVPAACRAPRVGEGRGWRRGRGAYKVALRGDINKRRLAACSRPGSRAHPRCSPRLPQALPPPQPPAPFRPPRALGKPARPRRGGAGRGRPRDAARAPGPPFGAPRASGASAPQLPLRGEPVGRARGGDCGKPAPLEWGFPSEKRRGESQVSVQVPAGWRSGPQRVGRAAGLTGNTWMALRGALTESQVAPLARGKQGRGVCVCVCLGCGCV